MKILVLQGSPNANGSTATLAHEFAAGAREAGNDVDIVDVASLEIAPCTGCVACGYGGPCAQYDDFDELREQILASDMLVFATPLYYYGMTATQPRPVNWARHSSKWMNGERRSVHASSRL